MGISGYSGREILKLMLNHPGTEVIYASANKTTGPVAEIWPELAGKTNLICQTYNLDEASKADLIFLATPHTISMKLAPELLKRNVKVIDMSGDFRLSSEREFVKWYKAASEHSAPDLLDVAVYGLPELYSEQIKDARLVANPGCYPTVSILAVRPLLDHHIKTIYIDAKSGVSGAGIRQTERLMVEMKDNFKAYKILAHQHTPEITEQLALVAGKPIQVAFVPHLLPIERGIFATIYVSLESPLIQADAQKLFESFYKNSAFVKVLPGDADLAIKNVVGTNNLQIQLTAATDQNLLVITSVIDNLIKGAAGQAVQNFNIMFGLEETTGLK